MVDRLTNNSPPAQKSLLETDACAGGWKRISFCSHGIDHPRGYDLRNYEFLRYGFGIANSEQHEEPELREGLSRGITITRINPEPSS